MSQRQLSPAPRPWAIRELTYMGLAAMDVCLFLPLVAGLLGYVRPVPPVALAAALLASVLVIHYAVRATVGLIGQPWLRVAVLSAAILVSGTVVVHEVLYPGIPLWSLAWPVQVVAWLRQANAQGLTIPREGFVFLLVVFLWWRGLSLAQRRTQSADVAFRFRLGVIVLAVATALGGLILAWPVAYVVYGYFFFGLVTIALARAEEAQRQRDDGRSVVGVGWFAGVLAAGLAVVAVASLVATIMTGDNLNVAVRPLLLVVRGAVIAIVLVAGLVAEVVVRLARLFVADVTLDQLRELVAPLRDLRPPPVATEPSRWSVDQLAAWRSVAVLGLGAAAIVAVALSVRWLRRRSADRDSGYTESVWEGISLRSAATAAAHGAREWMDGQASGLRRGLSRYWAVLTIRRVYGRVLNLAAGRGHPRIPNQTPYEYLPILREALPNLDVPLGLITEAYVAAHYGEAPDEPADLDAVVAAWEEVRRSAAQTG